MRVTRIGKAGATMLALLLLAGIGMSTARAAQPVLVELFTSEGCSSCPPADALLRRLVTSQPIAGVEVIGLEEHVDYWNNLGWRDPFSAAQFTRRQYQYASALGESSAYTPQMVVNGRDGFVGSDSGRAVSAIAAARKTPLATVSLSRTYVKKDEAGLQIEMKRFPPGTANGVAEVWLAVTEDDLADRVTAGENDGRRLLHDAVVRRLELIGRIAPSANGSYSATPTIRIAPGWKKSNLHAVVFVQAAGSRHILGIAELALMLDMSHDKSRGIP
ncbi:MAG: DUF1223 domain-containing protein [Gammaproteobacteria bacterium]